MSKRRILVVDDEEDILELVRFNLEREGYEVRTVTSGEDCLAEAKRRIPDLILLDVMLPGSDGLTVCRKLKAEPTLAAVPVIMLTAKGDDVDVITGLELGADDYVTKPFSPRVLVARIRAALRREQLQPGEAEVVVRGGVRLDSRRHEVLVDDQPVALTAAEFRALSFLIRNPGAVLSREKIIEAVHGDDYPVTDRSVDVQMVGLRRKLGAAGRCIETVRGAGYRFRE